MQASAPATKKKGGRPPKQSNTNIDTTNNGTGVPATGDGPAQTPAIIDPPLVPQPGPVPSITLPPGAALGIDPVLEDAGAPGNTPCVPGPQAEHRPTIAAGIVNGSDANAALAVLLDKIKQLECECIQSWHYSPQTDTACTAVQIGNQQVGASTQAGMHQPHTVTPAHTLSDNPPPGSVRKPRGSAGGGRRGFHLAAAMGLGDIEGSKMYNMILVRAYLL